MTFDEGSQVDSGMNSSYRVSNPMVLLLLSDLSELDLISTAGITQGVHVKQSCLAQLSVVADSQLRQTFVMVHHRDRIDVEACIVD